jgi:glycosyltransferase involved in cell wall biosynthesis
MTSKHKLIRITTVPSSLKGHSLSSIEAMASEKPVIASAVDGLKQVVEGSGLLLKKGDEKDLAEKITSLISSPELYKEVLKD